MAVVHVRPGGDTFRWRGLETPETPLFPGLVHREFGRGEFRGMEFLHVEAKRIINEVPSASRVPFRWTINAYRGCSHACRYCFARPTHEYLNLGTGRDFETKIVVKVNAVERVRAELAPRRWAGEHIAMGTNTDPYQRAEGKYRLTRGIVEVLSELRNPFSILTKGTLIVRDLDLLVEAAERTSVAVNFSIGTLDDEVWKLTEPGTPHPRQRVDAMARLSAAGVDTGVLVAPILPGLSDGERQIDDVVAACLDAGARSISPIMLHLRPGVRDHYIGWLAERRPDLLARHESIYRRGAYAPNDVQRRIAERVARAIERHGGLAPRGGGARRITTPACPTAAPVAPQQLHLDV
ncbi:MAG TPA: radical SAM protein [Acidimicrobiia bacterium]|nr:radical SAM protein [Acidimicrobiia bacterium]